MSTSTNITRQPTVLTSRHYGRSQSTLSTRVPGHDQETSAGGRRARSGGGDCVIGRGVSRDNTSRRLGRSQSVEVTSRGSLWTASQAEGVRTSGACRQDSAPDGEHHPGPYRRHRRINLDLERRQVKGHGGSDDKKVEQPQWKTSREMLR